MDAGHLGTTCRVKEVKSNNVVLSYKPTLTDYAGVSGIDTNLPVSCTGRFMSLIKSSFELFCALVGNLAHFLAQNLNFSYS